MTRRKNIPTETQIPGIRMPPRPIPPRRLDLKVLIGRTTTERAAGHAVSAPLAEISKLVEERKRLIDLVQDGRLEVVDSPSLPHHVSERRLASLFETEEIELLKRHLEVSRYESLPWLQRGEIIRAAVENGVLTPEQRKLAFQRFSTPERAALAAYLNRRAAERTQDEH